MQRTFRLQRNYRWCSEVAIETFHASRNAPHFVAPLGELWFKILNLEYCFIFCVVIDVVLPRYLTHLNVIRLLSVKLQINTIGIGADMQLT